MHDLLPKSTDPGLSFVADSMGLAAFTFTQRAPKSYIEYDGTLRSFSVVQGHRNWYQSKAHMHAILIRLLLSIIYHIYLLPFLRYNDCLVVCLRISPLLRTPVTFVSLTRGVPWNLGHESWCQNTRVPDGENPMILRSLVLSRYQRVTDGWTDAPPVCLRRALAYRLRDNL